MERREGSTRPLGMLESHIPEMPIDPKGTFLIIVRNEEGNRRLLKLERNKKETRRYNPWTLLLEGSE